MLCMLSLLKEIFNLTIIKYVKNGIRIPIQRSVKYFRNIGIHVSNKEYVARIGICICWQ